MRLLKTRVLFFIILLLLPLSSTLGGRRTVSYIKFRDIEGVDRDFLAEEISMKEGNLFSPAGLQEDMRRLENLRLFSRIEADTVGIYGGGVGIIYTLEETLHWIITPFIYKEDRYGLVYGIQYAHSNLFGRKYTTYCAGNSGGLKGGQINFDREMTYSRMYGFETTAELDESEHPVLDFWRQSYLLNLSLHRRLGPPPKGFSIQRYAGISVALEVKEFELSGISLASDNSDVVVKNTLFYKVDDTDIIQNPGRGKRLTVSLGYWNINGSEGIGSVVIDGSAYRSLSRNLVLAGNIYAELYADPLPLYYRNFLGGYNFRGCEYGDYGGDSYSSSTIELRVLPRFRFNFWKSFFEPAAALFAEVAVIGGYRDFYEQRGHAGYGISLGFLTPYVSPFFHLAYNEKGELIDYFSLQNSWKF